jgi:hypothetical protein
LRWVFYNQPEYVKEFLDQNKMGELDQVLLSQVDGALKQDGRSQLEAEDIAVEVMFWHPADGREFSDDPPEPLSLEDQERVLKKLERRQELLGLLDE